MKRIIAMGFLLIMTFVSINLVAQVNPYKEGTPGVTGYRSEVMAEVMALATRRGTAKRPMRQTLHYCNLALIARAHRRLADKWQGVN